MEPVVINVDLLPAQLREKFTVKKVYMKEDNKNIVLTPVDETPKRGELWGILSDGKISSGKFLEQKRTDKELEK